MSVTDIIHTLGAPTDDISAGAEGIFRVCPISERQLNYRDTGVNERWRASHYRLRICISGEQRIRDFGVDVSNQ
jgi:hypothetical protein